MLRIDGLNANKVLSITASETLTKEDYNRLLPELEEKLEKQRRIYDLDVNYKGVSEQVS